jgi:hypothetical protein
VIPFWADSDFSVFDLRSVRFVSLVWVLGTFWNHEITADSDFSVFDLRSVRFVSLVWVLGTFWNHEITGWLTCFWFEHFFISIKVNYSISVLRSKIWLTSIYLLWSPHRFFRNVQHFFISIKVNYSISVLRSKIWLTSIYLLWSPHWFFRNVQPRIAVLLMTCNWSYHVI